MVSFVSDPGVLSLLVPMSLQYANLLHHQEGKLSDPQNLAVFIHIKSGLRNEKWGFRCLGKVIEQLWGLKINCLKEVNETFFELRPYLMESQRRKLHYSANNKNRNMYLGEAEILNSRECKVEQNSEYSIITTEVVINLLW